MAIKGLTEKRRLPRLGKIHLGAKVANKEGVLYPRATDYFVCPPEVQQITGEKPKALLIMFPIEDQDRVVSQYYRCYSMSRGLICKGDGENATMLIDIQTNSLATAKSTKVEMRQVPCPGQECPYYGEQCREIMNIQFLMPEVPGLGVWQIDTSSINSIININSTLALIKDICGRISFIPLKLTLEEQEVSPEGKKKKVHVLNLRFEEKLIDITKLARAPIETKLLPEPIEPEDLPTSDDETPDLLLPQNQEPSSKVKRGRPKVEKAAPPKPPEQEKPAEKAQTEPKKETEKKAAPPGTPKKEPEQPKPRPEEERPSTDEDRRQMIVALQGLGYKSQGEVRSLLYDVTKKKGDWTNIDIRNVVAEAKRRKETPSTNPEKDKEAQEFLKGLEDGSES